MANHDGRRGNYIITKSGVAPIYGIDGFKKNLERLFFANCNISYKKVNETETVELLVELNCNFGLTQGLFHLNNGDWGGFSPSRRKASKFDESIQRITGANTHTIDIGELVINFVDTCIVISKIYSKSIICSLDAIFGAISANFVYLTKGVSEMPYEIFIPVFVDSHSSPIGNLYGDTNNLINNYFDYWGLYFKTTETNYGATIYDVKNKNINEGDFLILDF